MICSFLNSVIFTACDYFSPLQEIGRAVGVALMKQCGWRADLRDADLEVVVLVCQMVCSFFQICPQLSFVLFNASYALKDHGLSLFVFLLLNLTRNHLVALSKAF